MSKSKKLRVENLGKFQLNILKHSFQNFQNAEYIVYSTCSIFITENEEVVKKFLSFCLEEEKNKENPRKVVLINLHEFNEGINPGFSNQILKEYFSNQDQSEKQSKSNPQNNPLFSQSENIKTENCVRAYPFTETHDGFFVALFKIIHS